MQPPIQWALGTIFLGLKRSEREADRSFPSSVDFEKDRRYTSTPPECLHGVLPCLLGFTPSFTDEVTVLHKT